MKDDEKQLIQFRRNGFSFNRLTPYDSLDSYVPEIERTWNSYRSLAEPGSIRRIALRYINRLLLPVDGGNLRISDYQRQPPQLPSETNLLFTGFLHQHQAVESVTGNKVAIIIASQPVMNDELPILLDITASKDCRIETGAWEEILEIILTLRGLKNGVFKQSLTRTCLNRYSPQPS